MRGTRFDGGNMSQAAASETVKPNGGGSEIDAFRERVKELREKLERANGGVPIADDPAPTTKPAAPRAAAPAMPPMAGLPAAIEQKMLEATQRIEQLAAREHDLTNLLRRTRDELDGSQRAQEQAVEELRIAEERVRAAIDDGDQAIQVAEGLRQQVEAQRKRIDALANENRALQERNDRINAELQQAAKSEAAARNELQRMQSAFDAMQDSYDETRRQKSDLEKSLSRTSNRINEFETELMSQLQHLETEYVRIEREANTHEARADKAEAELDQLRTRASSFDGEIASLRDALLSEEAKRSEEAEKRRTIDARLEALQDELSGMQSRYAADLVELDAARQNAARYEKRSADLTEELQAYRKMQEQHEAAFAQMDSLFRSLDAKKAKDDEAKAPKNEVETAPAPVPPVPAPEPVSVKAVPEQSALKPVAVAEPAPKPEPVKSASARPVLSREEATNNARERLGKSLEALQALAKKRAPAAPVDMKPVAKPESKSDVVTEADETELAAAEAAEAPRPVRKVKVAPVKSSAKKAQAPATKNTEASGPATPSETKPAASQAAEPEVEQPREQVDAPAIDTDPDRMSGFIMPKPRLIARTDD